MFKGKTVEVADTIMLFNGSNVGPALSLGYAHSAGMSV